MLHISYTRQVSSLDSCPGVLTVSIVRTMLSGSDSHIFFFTKTLLRTTLLSLCSAKIQSSSSSIHRFTYWLSLVPFLFEFLISFQAEESVSGHIVHLVVHNPMRLRIKTLQEQRDKSTQSKWVVLILRLQRFKVITSFLPIFLTQILLVTASVCFNCRIWIPPSSSAAVPLHM